MALRKELGLKGKGPDPAKEAASEEESDAEPDTAEVLCCRVILGLKTAEHGFAHITTPASIVTQHFNESAETGHLVEFWDFYVS